MATKAELEHLRKLYNDKASSRWLGDERSIAVYDDPVLLSYREVSSVGPIVETVQRVIFERQPLYNGGQRIGWVITTSEGLLIGIAK